MAQTQNVIWLGSDYTPAWRISKAFENHLLSWMVCSGCSHRRSELLMVSAGFPRSMKLSFDLHIKGSKHLRCSCFGLRLPLFLFPLMAIYAFNPKLYFIDWLYVDRSYARQVSA